MRRQIFKLRFHQIVKSSKRQNDKTTIRHFLKIESAIYEKGNGILTFCRFDILMEHAEQITNADFIVSLKVANTFINSYKLAITSVHQETNGLCLIPPDC